LKAKELLDRTWLRNAVSEHLDAERHWSGL